jgi:hypothetical protein
MRAVVCDYELKGEMWNMSRSRGREVDVGEAMQGIKGGGDEMERVGGGTGPNISG